MPPEIDGLGDRLRDARTDAGISQRELARRLDLSPSLISQLEKGISKPSVGTLYAIVTELGVSVDTILRGVANDHHFPPTPVPEGATVKGPLVRPDQRRGVELSSGVRWEELTPRPERGIDFLHTIYEPGGATTEDGSLMRHNGRESGYVMSGTLSIQLGFETYVLEPGDSISFDSTTPHRFFNEGDETVHAIWLVVDRDDPNGSPLHA